MGPTHGERLAVLETVQGAMSVEVSQARVDIRKLSEKVDTQYADLKTTLLTKTVQTATRAAVWKDIVSRAAWLIGQAVIIAAAILSSSWLHVK